MTAPALGGIDLHLHTTASDGRCTPRNSSSARPGPALSVMAVTDHDTTAAVAEVDAEARQHGIHAITGIEITAVEAGRDLHVLGYLFDPQHQGLASLLVRQRAARVARIEAIASRLAAHGVPIDVEPMLEQSAPRERPIDWPAAGGARDGRGGTRGEHAGGLRSLARAWTARLRGAGRPHPGSGHRDHSSGRRASRRSPIPGSVASAREFQRLRLPGLDAVEAFHPDHDAALVAGIRRRSRATWICCSRAARTFTATRAHGCEPGSVTLPAAEWERTAGRRQRASPAALNMPIAPRSS